MSVVKSVHNLQCEWNVYYWKGTDKGALLIFTCSRLLFFWWFVWSCRAPRRSRNQPAVNRPSDVTSSHMKFFIIQKKWASITEIEILFDQNRYSFEFFFHQRFLILTCCRVLCVHSSSFLFSRFFLMIRSPGKINGILSQLIHIFAQICGAFEHLINT